MAKYLFKNSVESKFDRMLIYSIITAVITAIIGIVLIFMPETTNKIIGILVGIVFLISGVNAIYKYFHRDGAKLYSLNLVFGILYAILGIVIIVFPFSVSSFVTVCLGIYMIICGAMKVNYGFWLKRGNEDSWLVTIATGLLLIIFGIMVLFNPFVSLTLTRLSGIFLLIIAILDITNTIMFKKRVQEITEIFW